MKRFGLYNNYQKMQRSVQQKPIANTTEEGKNINPIKTEVAEDTVGMLQENTEPMQQIQYSAALSAYKAAMAAHDAEIALLRGKNTKK